MDINPFKAIDEIKTSIKLIETEIQKLWDFIKYEPNYYLNSVNKELMNIKCEIENLKKCMPMDVHTCNFE